MDIEKHLKKGESETLEFKETLRMKDEICAAVSSFSNACGGVILIGVTDTGFVKGLDIGKKTTTDLAEYIKKNTDPNIFPEIKVYDIDTKKIISLTVKESHDKPVFFKGQAHKRVGDTSPKINSSEIRSLAKESAPKQYWDEQICREACLEDIDWEFVEKKFIPLYERVSEKQLAGKPANLLLSLGCVKNNKPTNAGILLFGKDPQAFFRNAHIALARYKSKEVSVERRDYKEFTGNLFEQINRCNAYILEHISMMSKLELGQVRRQDIPEYGIFSIRELITNAVCHRDYENQHTKIIIKMFSDKIEFYNPGGLPEDITPQNITDKQYSRNPVFAGVLAKVDYIEELGEGWDKIVKEHKEHPLKPHIPIINSGRFTTLITIFSTKEKFEQEKEKHILDGRQRKIINYINKNGRITTKECADLLDVSTDTSLRELSGLKNLGFISKKGIGRATYYVIK